jgi:phage shock protein PspC (stress-responsive transcriptional regulator)
MNKVTIINLNGKAYQLEEAGYDALRKYLEEAAAKLNDNPDKDEIMADFEQAIAEKCDAFLTGHKDVVSAKEIESIILKMGSVEGTGLDKAEGGANGKETSPKPGPKRLYRILEGAYVSGVCTGIAAYFNWDVALVRAIFIILGILTHGALIIAYVLLALLLPVARTEEEIAEAFGEKFNAHEFLEKARAHYAKYADPNFHGRREWRRNMRAWKREWKEKRRNERYFDRGEYVGMRARYIGAGIFQAFIGIILAAFTIILIVALWSLVTHGHVLGIAIGAGHPLWVSIVFLCALFYVAMTPLRLIIKNVREHTWGPRRYHFLSDLMDALVFVLAAYLLVFTARELFPAVNEAWSTVVGYLRK